MPPDTSAIASVSAADRATSGYAALADGQRREGFQMLDDAITLGGDPRVDAWTRDRDSLRRRWSASAYVLARAGDQKALATRPVLGGAQAGTTLAYALDPLARRPLAVAVRVAAPLTSGTIDRERAQVALGATWRLTPGVTIAAERIIPLGDATSGAWTARVAGGASIRRSGVDLASYAEAGVVGRVAYAAAQARADVAVSFGALSLHPGAGVWASMQHDRRGVSRLDAGPGLRLRHRALPVELSVDYRLRVAGNAAPGSGFVVTLAAGF